MTQLLAFLLPSWEVNLPFFLKKQKNEDFPQKLQSLILLLNSGHTCFYSYHKKNLFQNQTIQKLSFSA